MRPSKHPGINLTLNIVKDEKGTVTIYLAVIFTALLLFTGLFIDLGRIKTAQNQFRRAVNASARSVLADYNTSLKKEYGLFALNQPAYSNDFARYLKTNLSSSPGQDFNLLDYRYEDSQLLLQQPLNNPEVLKQQILEDMKYAAPLDAVKGLCEKLKPVRRMAEFYNDQNNKRKIVRRINIKLKEIKDINKNIKAGRDALKKAKNSKQIERIKEEIRKEIEESKRVRREIQEEIDILQKEPEHLYAAGENGPVEDKILQHMKDFQKENTGTVQKDADMIQNDIEQASKALNAVEYENVDGAEFSRIDIGSADIIYDKLSHPAPICSQEQALKNDQNLYRTRFKSNPELANEAAEDEPVDRRPNFFGQDGSDQADDRVKTLNDIFTVLNFQEMPVKLRDEIYINEYILTHFSYLTSAPKGSPDYNRKNSEVEYILYGDNAKTKAVAQLYTTRMTLDTLAYFGFGSTPPELITKTIYALIMGAVQASVDTYKLLADGKNDVAVGEMYPSGPNPLNQVRLNYKDHLRLFLLLAHGPEKEKSKLSNIAAVMKQRSGIDGTGAFTLLDGSASVSIRMWFLPLAGVNNRRNGPFGTEIKNGRCYITKSVELCY